MPTFIDKLTGLVTTTTNSLTGLLIVVAVLSLIVIVLLAVVTHNDEKKSAKVKTAIWVLAVTAFASVAGSVVSWAYA